MPVIGDAVDRRSTDYQANRSALAGLVAELRARVAQAAAGGPEASRARHVGRGKLLPRERVALLLDPGAPFLEVSPLAAFKMYGDEVPAAGVVAGIGRVSGR